MHALILLLWSLPAGGRTGRHKNGNKTPFWSSFKLGSDLLRCAQLTAHKFPLLSPCCGAVQVLGWVLSPQGWPRGRSWH